MNLGIIFANSSNRCGVLSAFCGQANAAIKPRATAVAHRRCKRRRLKTGACSQIFNFAF